MPDAAIDALLAERPDPPVARPAETRPAWFGAVVVAVAVLSLADIVGLAVVADAGPGSGGGGLGQVRAFIKAQRTATFTGMQDDGGPTRLRNQLTTQGELRLPNESHVIRTRVDGSAEEILFHVEERFSRYAPSREELADEPWGGVERSPFSDLARENKAAAALAAISEAGAPVHLDTLLANLKRVRRIGDNKLEAEFKMAELIPEELKALAEAGRGDGADGEVEEVEDGEEGDDVSRLEDAFTGTLTVLLEYGEGGRLEVLRILAESVFDDHRSIHTEEFHFADWGKPVGFTLPDAADVTGPHDGDANDDAFRPGQARNAESFALLAARMEVFAPAALPRGWELRSKGSVSTGERQDLCGVIDYAYGPPEGEDSRLIVASSTPGCELIAEVERMLDDARRIEVDGRPAWILSDFPSGVVDHMDGAITGVLDRDGTRVIVSTTEDELFLKRIMRELKPIDPYDVELD